MFQTFIETVLGLLGTAVVAVIGWVFNQTLSLGTRVSVLENERDSREKLILQGLDDTKDKLEVVNERLTAIEGVLMNRNN